ncbi:MULTISPECIES: hypothetical protein [Hyphobacterium]|uniref:Tail specific protease domain-containing protein n=1 Tax=Hyphobacterium vulgare TaxID=1736751 RepID=A0ABV6ZYR1_9PROT
MSLRCFCAAMSALACLVGFGATALAQTGDADWNADMDSIVATLEAEHPNPYWLTPKAEFDAAVAAWRRDLPGMNRAERIAGMARIVGLVGDGHTAFLLHDLSHGDNTMGPGFRLLPVRFELFDDGLYIVGATPAHAGLVGGRVESFGGLPPDEAVGRILVLMPRDAVGIARELAPETLMLAEIAAAVGLSDTPERIDLVVSRNGETVEVALAPLPHGWNYEWMNHMDTGPWGPDGVADWVTASPDRPDFLDPSDQLRSLDTDVGGAAYLQIWDIRAGEDGFDAAGRALAAAGEAFDRPRVIIDLRRCRGGDGSLNSGFVDALANSAALNRPGGIIVLTSRQTHSAAIMLVSELEQRTSAIFVGQHTADRPNHYGETNFAMTPNLGFAWVHSSIYWQTSTPDDARRWRDPDIAIPYRFADYVAGRDPVLEAALEY